MSDTVACKTVQNWWNGKVVIDEIKIYADKRGMVSEVWRVDSLMGKDSKQCYISETEPYVQRGPHEHVGQEDNFISWKNNMVYEMYNPETEEMKTFITEKDKIYRVYVAIGIIHSYRNLDSQKSFTLNFPTALFMGEGKKDKIDEIRHEEHFKNNNVIVIFGAGGKLGTALTDVFYERMGGHNHDVIPVYEKLKDKDEVSAFFARLDLAIGQKINVIFFNCAALTNVQDVNTQESNWEWSNVNLPVEFSRLTNMRGWKFIQFSTDYVFQKVETNIINYNLSSYTRSKMRMEDALHRLGSENTVVVRVANLCADNDDHNAINKMHHALKTNGFLKVDPRLKIFPSHVIDVSRKLYELYGSYVFGASNKYSVVHLIPDAWFFLPEFTKVFFNVDAIEEKGRIQPWHEGFENHENSYIFNSNVLRLKALIK